ncbi:CPBP family intramembrane glutamic endopeptidase [Christiangramia salexigens]|uniref:Abortive phage infection protein n=1 Tax=Christiangramia salexigens TaxID=1913577 RepID=A0A1L3J4D9_9FLAO|nr:CPBP family intramembrane glutamic endopeptidase [Christiangramia salexigens]APG60009.1 abortive phage infection protein [Christiangramia salexigens]
MFISQIFNYKYDFWRYIIGVIMVIAGVIIGQIPLTIAIFMELGLESMDVNMTQEELMKVLDPNYNFFLLLLSYAVGLLFLFFAVRKIHGQSLVALTTSRPRIDWSRFWFAFGLVSLFIIITSVGDYLTNPQDYKWNFELVPFLILLVLAVVMVPLQTSFEEYFFRAYLMQGIGALARNKWLPLVVTSVIFGSLHFFNPEVTKLGNIIMIYYIGTGFMLGIMALMDEGIELALGFHAANNLLTALIVTADWTAFQTPSIFKDVSEPSAGWDILIPIFVVYPLFLFIMARRYGWKNWKEKLFGKVEKPEILNVSEEI